MSRDVLSVLVVLALYLLLTVVGIIKGWRKGLLKFYLKKSLNDSRTPISFIWCAYFIVLGAIGTIKMAEWTMEYRDKTSFHSLEWYVWDLFPLICVLTILYIAWKIVLSSKNPLIKYTEEEALLLKEERDRSRKTLKKLPLIGKLIK